MSRPALALAFAIPTGLACWWAWGDDPAPASGATRGRPHPEALVVLTYNVCFERPAEATVEAIATTEADLVFLQETNAAWEDLLEEGLRDRYPVRRFHHADPDGGLALLSRHPLTRLELRDSPVDGFPAWCLRFDTPQGKLDVLSVHLHPPLHDGSLLAGYFLTGDDRHREILAHLECFDGPPDLAVGDFNEEEGEAVAHLEQIGMRQAQQVFAPVERTWRWPTALGELTGRPDHVFVGPRWDVAGVLVPRSGASDHWPVVAMVRPGGAP